MIYLVNFANEDYRQQQKDCTRTALKYGKVDKVIEYTEHDLDSEYINSNIRIAYIKRGFGLWLWKPYLILKTIDSLHPGDIIVYADAGISFVNSITHLIPFLDKANNDILVFDYPLLNVDWTKAEAFKYANFTPESNTRQIYGGFIILKVSDKSRTIVSEWYELCRDERILSPKIFDKSLSEQPFFKAHREDQSVLTIVAYKNGVSALPDPSDYGLFDFCFKQMGRCNLRPEHSRPYPTIILINRKVKSSLYRRRYRIKQILHNLGLYNNCTLTLKNKLKSIIAIAN